MCYCEMEHLLLPGAAGTSGLPGWSSFGSGSKKLKREHVHLFLFNDALLVSLFLWTLLFSKEVILNFVGLYFKLNFKKLLLKICYIFTEYSRLGKLKKTDLNYVSTRCSTDIFFAIQYISLIFIKHLIF